MKWQNVMFAEKALLSVLRSASSHRRSNRTWKPNVRKVRAVVNGSVKSMHVCTRCLRSGKVERAV